MGHGAQGVRAELLCPHSVLVLCVLQALPRARARRGAARRVSARADDARLHASHVQPRPGIPRASQAQLSMSCLICCALYVVPYM